MDNMNPSTSITSLHYPETSAPAGSQVPPLHCIPHRRRGHTGLASNNIRTPSRACDRPRQEHKTLCTLRKLGTKESVWILLLMINFLIISGAAANPTACTERRQTNPHGATIVVGTTQNINNYTSLSSTIPDFSNTTQFEMVTTPLTSPHHVGNDIKIDALRSELKKRELNAGGRKADVIDRLNQQLDKEAKTAAELAEKTRAATAMETDPPPPPAGRTGRPP